MNLNIQWITHYFEREKKMNCPICNKNTVELKIEELERDFRKEKFKVFQQFYFCNSCKNDFTTSEQDGVSVNQVYNQYREKHSIPFPEEIKLVRETYNISSSKIAEVLGFGINQYRNYEAGEMPNNSNSKTLKVICNPIHFKAYIEQSSNIFKTHEYEKIMKLLNVAIEKGQNKNILSKIFEDFLTPNKFNGYTIPSFKKFFNMILFFNDNAFFQVRLNKFLFYADFSNYRKTGKSISGLPYAAITMGSVPDRYKTLMDYAEIEGYIEYGYDSVINSNSERIINKVKFESSLFNNDEIESMNVVLDTFRFKTTDEIKDLCHTEKAWTENHNGSKIISYLDYAPLLKEI